MVITLNLLLFLLSAAIIWFFSGLLIESIDKVAKRFHQSGFTVAFFVLGFLTSISEISVMVNSSLEGRPGISAGNLVGASLVLLLFIIPLLAIVGKGISLNNSLHKNNLAIALFAILLPSLLLLDGNITRVEGLICILVYGTLAYLIRKQKYVTLPKLIEDVEEELINKDRANWIDGLKIVIGAIFIFIAGNILVDQTAFFAQIFSIPSSLIGLLILSIGTNIPELVVALRAILKKRKEIAFGDYVGSAVANTFIFGLLPLVNKPFKVEVSEFVFTSILSIIGFSGFYLAARTKDSISKKEGWWLISIYILFIIIQIINLLRFTFSQ